MKKFLVFLLASILLACAPALAASSPVEGLPMRSPGVALTPQPAPVAAQTVTWDYDITKNALCTTSVTVDCIDAFILSYDNPSGAKVVAGSPVLPATACVASPAGVTCTTGVPTVQSEKYKIHTWYVQARAAGDGVLSVYSNALSVFLPPGTPTQFRAP